MASRIFGQADPDEAANVWRVSLGKDYKPWEELFITTRRLWRRRYRLFLRGVQVSIIHAVRRANHVLESAS